MNIIESLTDSYDFGWNITRELLAGKETYLEKTAFGDYIVKLNTDLQRSIEAERLHHKYSKMLHRKEKAEYCRGALALIEEWDIIGECPAKIEPEDEPYWDDDFSEHGNLNEFDDLDQEEYEGYDFDEECKE